MLRSICPHVFCYTSYTPHTHPYNSHYTRPTYILAQSRLRCGPLREDHAGGQGPVSGRQEVPHSGIQLCE